MDKTGRVLVFGAAGIDTLAQSSLRAHESVPGTITTAPGGVACNVALNLARLGVDVSLVACIGDDDDGRRVTHEIAHAGVDTRYLSILHSQNTARYVALLDDDGDMRLAVSSMDTVEKLTAADVTALRAETRSAAALVADANLPTDTLREVLTAGGTALRCVDTVSAAKSPRVTDCLANTDILKTTSAEASALTGVDPERASDLCSALLDRGVGIVFLSLGAKGLRVAMPGFSETLVAPSTGRVHSTSGAGDALLAGIVLGRLMGESVIDAANLGLAAASLTLACDTSTRASLSRELLIETRKQRATNA